MGHPWGASNAGMVAPEGVRIRVIVVSGKLAIGDVEEDVDLVRGQDVPDDEVALEVEHKPFFWGHSEPLDGFKCVPDPRRQGDARSNGRSLAFGAVEVVGVISGKDVNVIMPYVLAARGLVVLARGEIPGYSWTTLRARASGCTADRIGWPKESGSV